MSLPSDPADALKWALGHTNEAWWVVGAIAAGIAWTSKRLRDWNRRNAIPIGPSKLSSTPWTPGAPAAPPAAAAAPATASSASSYTAAASYAAAAYAAQPAYAAPAATPSPAGPARRLHREMPAQGPGAPAQRGVVPVARSVDVPAATGAWTMAGAFGDPAHARTAIVIAEVLGRPVGLR